MHSLNAVIIWYLYLFVIGLIYAPFTSLVFGSWYDKGYQFSKTIGILLLTYAMFLMGTLHVLPFTQESLILILVISGYVIFTSFRLKFIQMIKNLTLNQWFILLFEEIVFFCALLFLFFIRGQEPSIHGLEKFMDYGFMQSIGRSRYFPPLDMWLSADYVKPNGYPINYYYFGHLTGALLTKLTSIPSVVSYNLILATIFAQGVTLAFSWTYNAAYLLAIKAQFGISKTKLLIAGIVGSILTNFAGNLHTMYIFTKGYENDKPIPICNFLIDWWTTGKLLSTSPATCTPFQTIQGIRDGMAATNLANNTEFTGFFQTMITNSKYWYPNATRFIPFTIHEFPSYSYVVADLHGHVFDIPFVILTLALILTFFVTNRPQVGVHTQYQSNKNNHVGVIGFITRKWYEFNSYAKLSTHEMIWTVAFGAMIAIHYMTNAFDGPIYILLITCLFLYRYRLTAAFFLHTILLGLSYLIFSLPFSHAFKPFVSGIGVNCSPDFLVKMQKLGPFLFEKGNCQSSPLWMMFTLWGFFLIMFLLLLTVLYLQGGIKKHLQKTDWIVAMFFLYGLFLITIPEFIYIKDIYPAHFRANTLFKLGYQAYIMMSMSSGYVIYRILSWHNFRKYMLILVCIGPCIVVSIYSYFAFPSYYPGLNLDQTYQSIPSGDGAAWVQTQYPHSFELITYLNTQIIGQPIILEAQGDSYTDLNLISAYTGLPTVAGWWVHEWLWRGSSDVVGSRIPDISAIYESEDVQQTMDLLKKYHVSYVVITPKEREKYTHLREKKFSTIGVKIFESSDRLGALYRIN